MPYREAKNIRRPRQKLVEKKTENHLPVASQEYI